MTAPNEPRAALAAHHTQVVDGEALSMMEARERLGWQAVDELKGAIRPLLDATGFDEHVELRAAFNNAAVLAGKRLDIIQRALSTPLVRDTVEGREAIAVAWREAPDRGQGGRGQRRVAST